MQSLEVILPLFLILVMSLSVHEAAHAWTANRLGDPTARMLGRLTLNPLSHIDWIGTVLFPMVAIYSGLPILGWAKPVPVNTRNLRAPRRDFAAVAVAGPVSNLVLAAGLAAILSLVAGMGGIASPTVLELLWRAVSLNVLLAVFNMLPVPPLDGGNVLAGVAPAPVGRLIDQLRPYGFIVVYVLLLSGILGAIVFPVQRVIVGWLV